MADQDNKNQAQQDVQRRAEEQRRASQQRPQGGSPSENTGVAGQQQGGQSPQEEQARQVRRQKFDEEKRMVQERPQQVGDEGQKPTPTQQENDELRNGLRNIDDKEDDGSGPDFVHNRVVRRVEADQSKGKYETR